MPKINISFIADHASLSRDEQGNLIVMAQGVDEDQWNDAPGQFKARAEAGRIAAEHEADVQAEIRRQAEEALSGGHQD